MTLKAGPFVDVHVLRSELETAILDAYGELALVRDARDIATEKDYWEERAFYVKEKLLALLAIRRAAINATSDRR